MFIIITLFLVSVLLTVGKPAIYETEEQPQAQAEAQAFDSTLCKRRWTYKALVFN
jgi:hypothetical protein